MFEHLKWKRGINSPSKQVALFLRQPIANSQPLKLVKVEDSQHSNSFANDEPLLSSDNERE